MEKFKLVKMHMKRDVVQGGRKEGCTNSPATFVESTRKLLVVYITNPISQCSIEISYY
jgi:hypothetical protein